MGNILVLLQWGVVLVVVVVERREGVLGGYERRGEVSLGAYITPDCCCSYITAAAQQHLLREAHIVLKINLFHS